jgi:hypothetical protein
MRESGVEATGVEATGAGVAEVEVRAKVQGTRRSKR